jgi:hypothetical protein
MCNTVAAGPGDFRQKLAQICSGLFVPIGAFQWLERKKQEFLSLPALTLRLSGLAAVRAHQAPRTDLARPECPSAGHARLRRAENP